MSPIRVWKRRGVLTGILPSAAGGPDVDLMLPKPICSSLGGAVPFAMHLASLAMSFWLPLTCPQRRQLVLIWYRWRLICLVSLARLGLHFDLARRVLASPEAQLDAPLVALNI